MRSILLAVSILVPVLTHAQKITEYYENKAKAFEGVYRVIYRSYDSRDYFLFDTAADGRRARQLGSRISMLDFYMMPERMYEGECSFYYPNGKLSFKGTYTNGVKNGDFTYYYYDGAKEASRSYKDGMANGKWLKWNKSGTLLSQESYKALSVSQLDTLAYWQLNRHNATLPASAGKRQQLKFEKDSVYRSVPYIAYLTLTNLEDSFYRHAVYNGDFEVWYDNGNKRAEMHYADNIRTGKWMHWDGSGNLVTELDFENGKVVSVKYFPPRKPGEVAASASADKMVYTYVERMPEPPINLEKYLKENLVYPDSAKARNIEGRVILRFVVNHDGALSDFTVAKGIGGGCDEEAIRVFKSMPKWKPGMQNNKAVNTYYTVPVTFSLHK